MRRPITMACRGFDRITIVAILCLFTSNIAAQKPTLPADVLKQPVSELRFNHTALGDVLVTLGHTAKVRVQFAADVDRRAVVHAAFIVSTFEGALREVLENKQLDYEVLDEKTIRIVNRKR